MEEDVILDENEEAMPEEERINSELPHNVVREEIVISITDIVDIPLFTDELMLPERTSPLTFNDVFTNNEISREQPDIISQDVLFEVPAIIVPPPAGSNDDETYTIFLILGFALLGFFTMTLMNHYLKRKQVRQK